MPDFCPYCQSTSVWKQPEHFRAKEWLSSERYQAFKEFDDVPQCFDLIQFYPLRCVTCGSARGGAEPTEISGSRTLRLFLIFIGVLAVLFVLGSLLNRMP